MTLLIALLDAGSLAAADTAPEVRVTKMPVSVEYRSYAPGRPPPGIEASIETTVGVCDAQFKMFAQCHVQYPRLGFRNVTATLHTVDISLNLNVVIWLSHGSGRDVLLHEETHRQIAEHYYGMGESIARRIGQRVLGKQMIIPARNNKEALATALGSVTQAVVDDLQLQIADRCSYAQTRFDDITDHGRNQITVEEAKDRAIAEEIAHWNSRPGFSGYGRGTRTPAQVTFSASE